MSITHDVQIQSRGQPRDERLEELLAARALDALSVDEARELAERLRTTTRGASDDGFEPITAFDITATALELAAVAPASIASMPVGLRDRLMRSGEQWAEDVQSRSRFGREGVANPRVEQARTRQRPQAQRDAYADDRGSTEPLVTSDQFARQVRERERIGFSRTPAGALAPWLLAAASLAFAFAVWFSSKDRPGGVDEASGSRGEVARAIESLPDSIALAWGDWDNPEVRGIKGSVVWNEARQEGVMKFSNLPALKQGEQYQLWIVDRRGLADASGQSMRISGGVFDGGIDLVGKGELVVPIKPALEVQGAAAFAITIEQAGGTWVSDMKRRVVIAAKPS